ncbi:MAG: flagellar basal body-associated protein FliL [Alphaproteobacteria bacterium]|jgi:flagellar basal body-associated protein FliL
MADTDISIDEDPDEEVAEPAKISGRRKLILFALIGLLILGSVGGGSFIFFVRDTTVQVEDEPPVIEAPLELAYIDLEPIFIQVETSTGILQNVFVALALEVEDGSKEADRVRSEMPRLYEAYLRTLTDRPLPGAADGNVEVTPIMNRINAVNLRLLGPGVVYDVVLRNLFVTE